MRRSSRAPRRTLLAALIAAPLQGLVPAAGAQEVPGAEPAVPSRATAVSPGEETKAEGAKWQLAPIRWNGYAGITASVNEAEGQPRRSQFSEVFNIGAASYIWQPWFAQVMGGAGLLFSQSQVASDAGAESGSRTFSGGGSRGIIGNFVLNVFPVSRFPFQFTLDATDSRASGDFIGSDFRSLRVGLRQNYRTVNGDTSYSAGLESSILSSDNFGRDRASTLDGSMTTAWGNQRLIVNTSYTDNSRSSDDLGSRNARLSAQHSWRPEDLVSVESLASINHESRKFALGSSTFSSDVRQLSTLVNWRTDWDEPLIVLGTARLFDATSSSGADSTSGRAANLTGSASYRFSPNFSTFGTATLSQLENEATSETLTSQSIGAQYQIDPRVWGPATYTANAGVAAANQTGGQLGNRQQAQLIGGHRVSFLLASGESSGFVVGLGQDVAAIYESDQGSTNTISHTGNLGWRYSPPTGLAGYVNFSLGDSRSFGERESEFQIANFQISTQTRLGAYSNFSANFTAQVTRQVSDLEPEPQVTRTTSGGATFLHARLFGVPRLRYIAQFNAYNQQFDQRLQGNPNAPREQVSWLFEQRLEYVIGRLDSRLTLRVGEIDGKKNASLIASVNRRFGR